MPRSLVLVALTALLATPVLAADPPKAEEKPKRNAPVERVKLCGVGGLLAQESIRKELKLTE